MEDIPLRPKNNQWAYEKGLVHTTNLICVGTLGTSHSPVHFATMARKLVNRLDVRIVVVSQGPSVRYLESEKKKHGLDNLTLLTHEPFSRMPDLFGTADILLTVLNQDVADSSAPSKIMCHFCAGKPQLAIMPTENSFARTLTASGGGVVVSPADPDAIFSAAMNLIDNRERRLEMGRNARSYAEREIKIGQIGEMFESIMKRSVVDSKSNGVPQKI